MKAARFAISVFCLLIVLAFTGCSQRRNDYQLDHYKVYRASDYLDHYKVYKRYTGGELDHYKLYSATGPSQPEAVTVTLKDQFLEPSFDFIPATAEDIEYFAIPASKIMVNSTKAGRIRDSLTHLTWYKLNVEEQYQITVQVQFHNQLNDADQVWKIRGPVYLLVPTDKTERDGSASESAPRASSKRNENRHFLCYEIIEPITWIPPDLSFGCVETQVGAKRLLTWD